MQTLRRNLYAPQRNYRDYCPIMTDLRRRRFCKSISQWKIVRIQLFSGRFCFFLIAMHLQRQEFKLFFFFFKRLAWKTDVAGFDENDGEILKLGSIEANTFK